MFKTDNRKEWRPYIQSNSINKKNFFFIGIVIIDKKAREIVLW